MSRVSKIRVLSRSASQCAQPSNVQAQIDKWGYWQNGVSEAWWFSPAQFTTQPGLKRGMFLNVIHPRQSERVRILVNRTSAAGVIIRDLDENRHEVPFDHESGEPYSKIVAGRKLTTSTF